MVDDTHTHAGGRKEEDEEDVMVSEWRSIVNEW